MSSVSEVLRARAACSPARRRGARRRYDRHGNLMWRVRFHDERWLYMVLLLEFQVAVDRAMAVRMLAYTALLYQKLIVEGALREHDALPPVLPIVIYNGSRRWNAAADLSVLIASGGVALARYQPSQRYFLLDEGRVEDSELPRGNILSALDRAGDESGPGAAAGAAWGR